MRDVLSIARNPRSSVSCRRACFHGKLVRDNLHQFNSLRQPRRLLSSSSDASFPQDQSKIREEVKDSPNSNVGDLRASLQDLRTQSAKGVQGQNYYTRAGPASSLSQSETTHYARAKKVIEFYQTLAREIDRLDTRLLTVGDEVVRLHKERPRFNHTKSVESIIFGEDPAHFAKDAISDLYHEAEMLAGKDSPSHKKQLEKIYRERRTLALVLPVLVRWKGSLEETHPVLKTIRHQNISGDAATSRESPFEIKRSDDTALSQESPAEIEMRNQTQTVDGSSQNSDYRKISRDTAPSSELLANTEENSQTVNNKLDSTLQYHWGALADSTVVMVRSADGIPCTAEQLLSKVELFWQKVKSSKEWASATELQREDIAVISLLILPKYE